MKSKAGQAEYWVNGFQMMAEEVKKNSWPLYLTVMNKLVTSMSQPVAPIRGGSRVSKEGGHLSEKQLKTKKTC